MNSCERIKAHGPLVTSSYMYIQFQFNFVAFSRFDSDPPTTDSENESSAVEGSGEGADAKREEKRKRKEERKEERKKQSKTAKTVVSSLLSLHI